MGLEAFGMISLSDELNTVEHVPSKEMPSLSSMLGTKPLG